MNRFDEAERHNATFHACVAAVSDGFPHLSIAAILSPPHRWFDAALARQIVIHLMVREFDIPKRRVVQMQERSREAVNRALRTIDERSLDGSFSHHYRMIATAAHSLFHTELTEAA